MKSSSRLYKAVLASLISPGLGQLFNGQIKKAIAVAIGFFVLTYAFLSQGDENLYAQLSIAVLAVALYVFALLDAIRNNKTEVAFLPKKYNKTFYYLLFICLKVNIRYAIFYALGFAVYTAATTANYPTVKVGDKFVLDKNAYAKDEPYYGDIVAFHYSSSGGGDMIRIHRIVGLPRDHFSVKNNSAVINGKYMRATFVSDLPRKSIQEHNLVAYSPSDKSLAFQYKIHKEFYPNDFSHFSCKNASKGFQHPMKDMDPIDIPSQHYFVMGDNRDNAMDSRFIGLVKKQDIVGKVKENTITDSSLLAYQSLFFWSSALSDYLGIHHKKTP